MGPAIVRNRIGSRQTCGDAVMIAEFLVRLRFIVFRKKRSEFDDELRFHIE